MVVDAPPPKSIGTSRGRLGVTEEEVAIYGSIRNHDDYERAQRELAALRMARQDAEDRRIIGVPRAESVTDLVADDPGVSRNWTARHLRSSPPTSTSRAAASASYGAESLRPPPELLTRVTRSNPAPGGAGARGRPSSPGVDRDLA
jgi:hypothetical protein